MICTVFCRNIVRQSVYSVEAYFVVKLMAEPGVCLIHCTFFYLYRKLYNFLHTWKKYGIHFFTCAKIV
jgi:hypothetical protein